MSLTYGFYNSSNGIVRKYNAEQMSMIFDGIINDGVFMNIGDCLMVKQNDKMTLSVGTGRAWFNGTWTFNDSLYLVDIPQSDPTLKRIDIVALEINKNTRTNSIVVISGTPATNATAPTWKRGEDGNIYQYPLAYITVKRGVTEILQEDIQNCVGTTDTPFVTGILEKVSTDELLVQWQAEFDNWFDDIRGVLDGDAAGNMAARILTLEDKVDVSKRTNVDTVTEENVVLVDEDKKISSEDLFFSALQAVYVNTDGISKFGAASAIHRSHYRGKLLGDAVTEKQLEAIRAGTFEDLWLGDHWLINGRVWVIVDFDYWYHLGAAYHHVVIMPETALYTGKMNETNTTEGGYVNSLMRKSGLDEAKAIIQNAFGDIVIQYTEYLVNAVTDGYPSGGSLVSNASVELPNEIMIYGCHIFAPNGDGSIDVRRYTNSHTQLALFAVNRIYIRPGLGAADGYWLRDVVNPVRFAYVESSGLASYTNASNKRGVRPVFAIG